MAISDTVFLNNVKSSLEGLHLTDIPLPFVVIKNKLYVNASKEQIYGLMGSDGMPLSPEDGTFSNKRFNTISSAMLVEFYDKVERLHSQIKQSVLSIAGASPPLTPSNTAQNYTLVHDSLFGPAGFFKVPNTPLADSSITILSDLFKELVNRSKGVKI
jgi:hypothetical protein